MERRKKTCGVAAASAGCEARRGLSVTAKLPGRNKSKMAKVSVLAKTVEPVSTGGAEDEAAHRFAGSAVLPEALDAGDEGGHDVAKSVAELAVIICGDPDNRKKRLKLSEALRERGLDEAKVAAMYVGLAEKLSRNKEQGAVGVAVAKLLFEVLKELTTHWLEPQKTADDSDAGEAPQFVRLIHNVPRPVRAE